MSKCVLASFAWIIFAVTLLIQLLLEFKITLAYSLWMLQCHSVFNSKYLHYALLGFQSRFLSPFYRDYWTKLIFAVIRKHVDTRMYITLLINYANALVYSSQNRNLKCLYFVCFLIWSDCIWYQHNCLRCIAINITVILWLFFNQDLQLKLLCSQCNFPNMVWSSWFFFFRSNNFVLFDLFWKSLLVGGDRSFTRFRDKFLDVWLFFVIYHSRFNTRKGLGKGLKPSVS